MDLLQIIKLVSIPRWIKFVSLLIILLFMGLSLYAIFGGPYLAEVGIVQAGMGLLGVLLPLSIAIVFLSFYEAGVGPLKKATESLLTQLWSQISEQVGSSSTQTVQKSKVEQSMLNEHACFYQIALPDARKLEMEIQLNVRKVCVVLYFAQELLVMLDVMIEEVGDWIVPEAKI